jgi:hypothetical protein
MPSLRFLKASLSLVAAFAASAALVTSAMASVTRLAGTGEFSSWSKAQHAAGFTLKRPGTTYGLKMQGAILVDQCLASGKGKDKIVAVEYGSLTAHMVGLTQDNASGPCGDTDGTSLGSYKIDGTAAHLYGECGAVAPQYSCSSTKIELWLIWSKGRDYYVASSFDESRSRLVRFARDLMNV